MDSDQIKNKNLTQIMKQSQKEQAFLEELQRDPNVHKYPYNVIHNQIVPSYEFTRTDDRFTLHWYKVVDHNWLHREYFCASGDHPDFKQCKFETIKKALKKQTTIR